jgi:hypothetical protein
MLTCLSRFAVVAERQCPAASPIPHPVLLDSTASIHALQLARAMSSPTDIIAYTKLRQATAAAHVKFEAEEPLEIPPDRPCGAPRLHVFSPHMFQERLLLRAPCIRAQEGDRHVSCRPRPTPHGSLAERPTPHITPSASCPILPQTLVIILNS